MSAQETRNIGSRLELFVDDWLIERMDGVALKLHHPVPREVAVELDRPWGGTESFDPHVVLDNGHYKMWYLGRAPDPECACYAESDDGVHWRRPSLGICDFEGSKDNNVVFRGDTAMGASIFRDGNPETPDSERYKALGRGLTPDGAPTLRGLVSPDGIHWTAVKPDLTVAAPEERWQAGDTHQSVFWDPALGQYVACLRGSLPPGFRSIRRSVSSDFRSWSAPELIDLGDSPPEHLYTNACTPYFRAPHIKLMFPLRFVPDRKVDEDWDVDAIADTVLMTSRDGIHWDRRFMEAFLRPGLDSENWTDRNTYIGAGVVPTGPGEISVYFVEHHRHPSARLRRGALRTDGFVSVNGPYSGGELVTRPLTFDGGELVLNYATSAAGSVRVEIQDAEGQALDGYQLSESAEMFGDEIDAVVSWRGGADVSALAGRPDRIRFAMKDADLYSLRFK